VQAKMWLSDVGRGNRLGEDRKRCEGRNEDAGVEG